MADNPFKNLRLVGNEGKKSIEWYRKRISQLSGLNSNKLLADSTKLKSQIRPGGMYMFLYDAKYKDTLQYWDRFPLVLPFKVVPDGFYGINLHYLPYVMRFNLLGSLRALENSKNVTENTRLKLNWDLLNRMSSAAPIKSSVKHYLNEHVTSKFLEINYPDWVTASLLPVEQFQGAGKEKVWRNTRKAI